MLDFLNIGSFVLGVVVGVSLTAIGFSVRTKINVSRTGGDNRNVKQSKITAGGDVVGGDKSSDSDK